MNSTTERTCCWGSSEAVVASISSFNAFTALKEACLMLTNKLYFKQLKKAAYETLNMEVTKDESQIAEEGVQHFCQPLEEPRAQVRKIFIRKEFRNEECILIVLGYMDI